MESKGTTRFVVLLQSDDSLNNKYIKLLEEANISVKNISPLSFNFINEEKLQKCVRNADDYGGMIFTSTRAVTAVSVALRLCTDLCIAKWRDKINFAVGKATASVASSALSFDTLGSDSGNSANLCQFITEKYGKCYKPLIFPCSNIRKDTIPDALSENNIFLEEIVCYETIPNTQFETIWKNLVSEDGLPEVVVFFSPSGVQYCGKIIAGTYPAIAKPKFVAIGPSTEKALLEANMVPSKVAEKPNPQSVLCIIQDLL